MKWRLSGGQFLGLALLLCAAWIAWYSTGAVARAADKVMRDEAARGDFSGAVLISRNGNVIFEKAYGFADTEGSVANTSNTRFRIGSITKPFTAVLVMQLESQGRVQLTESICAYLDECPPGWRDIELHHLLSNTSGIYNFTDDPDVAALREIPQTREQVLTRFTHHPLAFAPGEKFDYSNSNFFLLGVVIEKVAGEPYDKVLARQILDPLDMRNTGTATHERLVPELARGYRRDARGKLSHELDMDDSWSLGSGALYSTLADLGKFSDALATGKLLPRAAIERMWSPVKGQYGYGWTTPPVSEHTFGRRYIEHGGRVPGFVTFLRRFVDDGLTIVVLSNHIDASPQRVANSLSAVTFGKPYVSVFDRRSIQLSPEARQRFLGDYEFDGRIYTIAERDGILVGRSGDRPEIEIRAESESVLYFPGSEGVMLPLENSRGEIVGLTFSVNGSERTSRKVR